MKYGRWFFEVLFDVWTSREFWILIFVLFAALIVGSELAYRTGEPFLVGLVAGSWCYATLDWLGVGESG